MAAIIINKASGNKFMVTEVLDCDGTVMAVKLNPNNGKARKNAAPVKLRDYQYKEVLQEWEESKIIFTPEEGYTAGFDFEDFKKGETVYIYELMLPENQPNKLIEGKVKQLIKEKNAKGEDTIRTVQIVYKQQKYNDKNQFLEVYRHVTTRNLIKTTIFKKIEKVDSAAQPSQIAETSEGIWIERAMGPKNKEVMKYLEKGYVYKEKKWDSEKNMYLSLVVKGGK